VHVAGAQRINIIIEGFNLQVLSSPTKKTNVSVVDSTIDPDMGEIMTVKKKKSRAALDGMHWGPFRGEVTNIPALSSSAVKNENAKEDAATRPLQPSVVLKLKRGEAQVVEHRAR